MAQLTVEKIGISGLAVTMQTANSGGDSFKNDGKTRVLLENSSGGNTVTFATPKVEAGLAIADPAIAVASGGKTLVGPFPPDLFNDGSGLVQMTYDTEANLTIGIFQG